jgi:magnesium/cobalt transport protein CorA
MKISAFLYDADGSDKELEFSEDICRNIGDDQLLWITVLERKQEIIEQVVEALSLKNAPVKDILRHKERPKLEKFENFYRIFVVSVNGEKNKKLEIIPIDFIVKTNVIVTIHDGGVEFFEEYRDSDKGETQLGRLNTESFIASLLDLHLVSYFKALENLEEKVDKLDEMILTKELSDDEFLDKMLELRRIVSKLRRLFLPHRDVFYALSRPDFFSSVESESSAELQKLNERFDHAVEAIESSRDMVLGLFDLYTTRAAHKMNQTIKTLTFVTIVTGGLGVIAGVFGMNFEVDFFKSSEGFWITILGMGLLAGGVATAAKMKNWI